MKSTPNKLSALDVALIVAFDQLGLHSRARIARAFGISATRVLQLCGPRQVSR